MLGRHLCGLVLVVPERRVLHFRFEPFDLTLELDRVEVVGEQLDVGLDRRASYTVADRKVQFIVLDKRPPAHLHVRRRQG